MSTNTTSTSAASLRSLNASSLSLPCLDPGPRGPGARGPGGPPAEQSYFKNKYHFYGFFFTMCTCAWRFCKLGSVTLNHSGGPARFRPALGLDLLLVLGLCKTLIGPDKTWEQCESLRSSALCIYIRIHVCTCACTFSSIWRRGVAPGDSFQRSVRLTAVIVTEPAVFDWYRNTATSS